METPALLSAYPPECCADRHEITETTETTETMGAEQFASDYATGWRRRALWKQLVVSLRGHDPAYRRAYATGYARAALPLAARGWDEVVFVTSALSATSVPPT